MNEKTVLILAGVGVLAFVVIAERVGKAAQAVNPLSADNIFYQGVNAVGDVLNDGQRNNDFSLGSAIYDWFGGAKRDAEALGPMEYPIP